MDEAMPSVEVDREGGADEFGMPAETLVAAVVVVTTERTESVPDVVDIVAR